MVTSDVAPATGWDTVTLLAELTAELLEAELIRIPVGFSSGRRSRALSLLPRRQGHDIVLVIASSPGFLYDVLDRRHLLSGDALVAGWVIDSFWTDRIPRVAGNRYDHLFITDGELVDEWHSVTGVRTHFLPFGSDVLRRGSASEVRPVDVLRVGRQPTVWENDDELIQDALQRGMVARGRTPHVRNSNQNQQALMTAMSGARFTLSFTNRLSPAGYTHPTREYLTGRWTDALASGATVAGSPPRCRAADDLLWPEATLELPHDDRAVGLDILSEATAAWSPDRARHNHAMALRRLDWRHRIMVLAEVLGITTPTLDREIDLLRAAIDAS